MRKTTCAIGIIGLLLLASFKGGDNAKPAKSDCAEMNLKGHIHTICEYLYNANIKADIISKQSDTPIKTDSTWFDEKGNKTDQKIYGASGLLLTEWSYTYDAGENLLTYTYSEKDRQRQKDTYKYDSAGRVIEWARYKGADSLCERDTYTYDALGNQIEQNVDEHYPIKQKVTHFYEYDDNNNRVKESEFKLGGSNNLAHTWTYNSMHKPVEQDDYAPSGRVTLKITFKYNDKGNVLERMVIQPGGEISGKDIYTYDAKGNKVADNRFNNFGKLYWYFTYTHDLHGNIKEEKEYKVYNDDGPQMENADTYELDYDKKGNWIKKTDLKIDGTVTLTQREISYY